MRALADQPMFKNIFIGTAFVAATFFSIATLGEDAVKSDPQHYTVEFENDRVRMTLPDGTSSELTGEAGATLWTDGDEHLPENLSDKPFELVLVEHKYLYKGVVNEVQSHSQIDVIAICLRRIVDWNNRMRGRRQCPYGAAGKRDRISVCWTSRGGR